MFKAKKIDSREERYDDIDAFIRRNDVMDLHPEEIMLIARAERRGDLVHFAILPCMDANDPRQAIFSLSENDVRERALFAFESI